MSERVASEELVQRLQDLQNGLHAAMDALIRNGDKEKAELILHQMDHHMRVALENIAKIRK